MVALWKLMQAQEERGFVFGLLLASIINLVVCGVLALGYTGRFLWKYRGEFRSLVRIIRFRAKEDNDDVELENGRNNSWEMDSMHSNEDDAAGLDYSGTESEGEDDSDGWCPVCREHSARSGTCSCERRTSASNPNEGKDENSRPDYNNEGEDNEGEGDNEPEEGDNEPEEGGNEPEQGDNELEEGDNEPEEDDQAGPTYDDTESEDEDDSDRWCPACKKYNATGWTCSCDLSQYGWSNANEGNGQNQENCPESKNDSDMPHLTPPSSGSDAEINTTTPGPLTINNWYAPPEDKDTESCPSCDSEYTKNIPWVRPAAHREPLSPTSPTAYVAGVEDDDDGEESNVSDDATIGEPEGEDTDTWNNGDSHNSTPDQRFQSEREDTGPLSNVQESNNQTSSSQEQRPQSTSTAFSPLDLPVGHANILVDETGHAQGPPVAEFRHGTARPLRLMIPTQGITNAEPRAPTMPAHTYRLTESAYAGNTWRHVERHVGTDCFCMKR